MEKKSNTKKSRKWWLWIIIALILIGSCTRNNDAEGFPDEETIAVTQSPTPISTDGNATDSLSIIDRFIVLYGSNSISDISNLDIRGNDYRTEYRLNSFKNAVGKKGIIDGGTIEIVNYGTSSTDSIRIYAVTDTLDSATALCSNVIHILDASISDDEISAELAPLENVSSANFYLGSAGYISGYINTNYENGGVSGYEIMIDCSKINF